MSKFRVDDKVIVNGVSALGHRAVNERGVIKSISSLTFPDRPIEVDVKGHPGRNYQESDIVKENDVPDLKEVAKQLRLEAQWLTSRGFHNAADNLNKQADKLDPKPVVSVTVESRGRSITIYHDNPDTAIVLGALLHRIPNDLYANDPRKREILESLATAYHDREKIGSGL